ncbi:protein of unknown function [Paraburkholderia dioscoreae]|uniref:Uncharacterized protein n=1 Tax=Paraburkholderia dioscoreae TaxID=2604047 RepID=A0A5Q4ZFI9_9BURK|nr:protein of unknown function [Paraburkholderia dioscoreae]
MAEMTMMHQFLPAAVVVLRISVEALASRLFADSNAFVDRAVHRDAAGARARARTGAALRAGADQQGCGNDGKKSFHDSVFPKTDFNSSLADLRGTEARAGMAAVPAGLSASAGFP